MAERQESVFVSSTCFDLIDVRSELEAELRSMELVPLLSDRSTSEFAAVPTANSIEACLVNVRRADIVLVILSQRYGPSLEAVGYGNLSATHLEYQEARKLKKPLYVYVRDRLEADYGIWKRNGKKLIELAWVKPNDFGLFHFLDEHRQLIAKSSETNWLWTFRDSVDLKERVRKDLKQAAGRAILKSLLESGKTAYLIPEVVAWSIDKKVRRVRGSFRITNAGTAVAIQPFATLLSSRNEDVQTIRTLLPGQSADVELSGNMTVREIRSGNAVMGLDCSYSTPEGHYVVDTTHLEFAWPPKYPHPKFDEPVCMYRGKRYHHSSAIELDSDIVR